jgi:Mg/Co/Ni transporter MgtE
MDSFSTQSSPLQSYQREAKTPIVKDGKWNERALRQVSTGSILGLVGGVVVAFFSKPLALLIGLLVIGAQVSLDCLVTKAASTNLLA